MHYGIFTYGSRGDVQPFIALALGLKEKGHRVTLGAPENFQSMIESYEIDYHKIDGDLEKMLYEPEIQSLLESGNVFALLKGLQKSADKNSEAVTRDLIKGCEKVDCIITTTIPLFYVACIAEKLNKPFVNIVLNPPTTPTKEFPFSELAFFDFPAYNKLTYKLVNWGIWSAYKSRINAFREQLGLSKANKNLLKTFEEKGVPTLYAYSESLIKRPNDWKDNYKTTGFLSLKSDSKNTLQPNLQDWISKGKKPIYIGFGSIPIPKNMYGIINKLIETTDERILLCKGWSKTENLLQSDKLFMVDNTNHELLLPQCKLAVFHGGAGTLSSVLKAQIPFIIVSIFGDQPIWGKLIEKRKLGKHISAPKLTFDNFNSALKMAQTEEMKNTIFSIGKAIKSENGVDKAIDEIEQYFERFSGDKQVLFAQK
jgi:sterol 3beta-glucosyltransferase